MNTEVSLDTQAVARQDDTSNCYIHIVEPEEHNHALTPELLETCSKNYTTPVVFRKMVPDAERFANRAFVEVELDQKLTWRERQGNTAVGFRNKDGKTDYNYVTGQEGSAREYLEQIFDLGKDVYSHLGYVSSGFKELHKYPWGQTLFNHLRAEVFRDKWLQIPDWQLSGHCFLGNNTENFAEPSTGAPGSDWHMFPTTNIFVMLAGGKKWMTRPPLPGDQLSDYEEVIFPSGGRENPVDDRAFDTVYLSPGDVLFNVPYEWHKVLNAKGWSLGAAFRVIDRPYVDSLLGLPAVTKNLKLRELSDNYAHLITSLRHASLDPRRMQMTLNTCEMMICGAAKVGIPT